MAPVGRARRPLRSALLSTPRFRQSQSPESTLSRQCASAPTSRCVRPLQDLKQRGLLDDTLVIWAASSADCRSPSSPFGGDYANAGRDQYRAALSPGRRAAASSAMASPRQHRRDRLRRRREPRQHADWHATILHLLGMHHEELFFERNISATRSLLTGCARVEEIRREHDERLEPRACLSLKRSEGCVGKPSLALRAQSVTFSMST